MSVLEEYQKQIENPATNNEYPEEMQYDGLTESDRKLYEEVLNKMRSGMNKANADMKKNSLFKGSIVDEVDGIIQNKKFRKTEEMATAYKTGNMYTVSEPISLFLEGYRCPHCGRLMLEDGMDDNGLIKYSCQNCGYTEETPSQMHFSFGSSYIKIPISEQYGKILREIFIESYKNKNKNI